MAQQERKSNIELLRIFSMLMIIAYHIFVHCVLIQLTDLNSIDRMGNGLFNTPEFYKKLLVLETIAPMGQVGNVIFILLPGYFMITRKKIDFAKIGQKLMVCQGICALVLVVMSTFVSKLKKEVFFSLLDINVFNSMSWYVGYYFLVILIASMFLNGFLNKLNKEQYKGYLWALFACTQFSFISNLANSIADGLLVLLTGVFLYSFGGYMYKYNPFEKVKGEIFLGIIGISYLFIYISNYNITINNIQVYDKSSSAPFIQSLLTFNDTHFLIPIIIGISIFEIFLRINMKPIKLINFFGASTFIIYLIHDNDFFYSIWNTQDWITLLYYKPYEYILKHLMWTLWTFSIGVLIYIFYIILIKKLRHEWL